MNDDLEHPPLLKHRESGEYREPEECLACDELVDASLPHVFVRDADETYPDEDALIGLVHLDCKEGYLRDVARARMSAPRELDEPKPAPSREEVLTAGGNLELQHEGSNGYRHYLNQEAVHAGSKLEVLTEEGWKLGRYEWSFNADRLPFLMFDDEHGITIKDDTILRWPA